MAKVQFKTWGKNGKTVRKHRTRRNIVQVREGENVVDVRRKEVDDLIIALMKIGR